MRRKDSLPAQVYKAIYPWPNKNVDPSSWREYVKQHLIPEIQDEVRTFYGSSREFDEMYPGLDYAYPPHRRRLARRQHHKELFEAFDELELTISEIHDLCTWDFTLYQKQRVEREHNLKIRDMTGIEIPTWEQLQRQRLYQVNQSATRLRSQDHESGQHTKEDDFEIADESEDGRLSPPYLSEGHARPHEHQNQNSNLYIAPRVLQQSRSGSGLVELEETLLSAARRLRAATPG